MPDISTNVISRIARRGGVLRISEPVYEEIRKIISGLIENITSKALIYTSHVGRRTINLSDALSALDIKISPVKNKSCPLYKAKKHKKFKIKPNVRALREIRFYQKNSDCLLIPKTVFRRLTREEMNNHRAYSRISPKALLIFQSYIENKITKLFQTANLLAVTSERLSVQLKDIGRARRIQE